LALRLLLDYGLRKGSLRAVQIKHFDHERRRLTIFAKGQRVRELPIPDRAFWKDLERHILEAEAKPDHFLLCPHKRVPVGPPDKDGHRRTELRHFPEKSMSEATAHRWWYDRLAKAGIVERGVT
jgi:integrase